MRGNGIFGYNTTNELINTLGFTFDWIQLKLSFVTIAIITSFITKYIYADSHAIYILMLLFLADFLSGVAKSLKNKTFSSYKLWRILPVFVGAMFILSISWHLSTVSIVYSLLPSLVYTFISSTLLVSLIENFGELGILDKELITTLKSRFSFKKLIKKYDAKDTNDNV